MFRVFIAVFVLNASGLLAQKVADKEDVRQGVSILEQHIASLAAKNAELFLINVGACFLDANIQCKDGKSWASDSLKTKRIVDTLFRILSKRDVSVRREVSLFSMSAKSMMSRVMEDTSKNSKQLYYVLVSNVEVNAGNIAYPRGDLLSVQVTEVEVRRGCYKCQLLVTVTEYFWPKDDPGSTLETRLADALKMDIILGRPPN